MGERDDEPCLWCDEPATLLCDRWLGCVPDAGMCTAKAEQFLCDAPMCRTHGELYGHISGDDPDTMDRCPIHFASRPEVPWDQAAKSAEAAERLRSDVRAQARRSRFRAVPHPTPGDES